MALWNGDNAYWTLDLFLAPRCSNKYYTLQACSCTSYCDMHVHVCALVSHHSSIVHCLHPVTSCKACRCAFDQRSVGHQRERSVGKTDHTESSPRGEPLRVGSERFFSLSLERQRSAGKMASFGRYAPAIRVGQTTKVLKIRSLFGRVCGIYDGTQMGNNRQTEPELKRCGPTRVRRWCINASVTCDPRQNKIPYHHHTWLCYAVP